MIVRKAYRADLLGIGRIAEAAHWASYEGLLRPDTIGRLILRDFSPSALGRRLLRGGVFVATASGEIVGFADGEIDPDVVYVSAIAADPTMRRQGIGTALLTAIRGLSPGVPVSADVFLGNLEGEQFYEFNGFVPGEIQHGTLFSEDVVERRWWREAILESHPQWDLASDG
jgi:GNAT superfamily N-acetyltransferase